MASRIISIADAGVANGSAARATPPEPETVAVGFDSPTADTRATLFQVNAGVPRSYALLIAVCLERSLHDLCGNGASLMFVADFVTRAAAALRASAKQGEPV